MEGVVAGHHFKTVRILQFFFLVRAAPSWYCWCHCDYCFILCFLTKHCDSEHVWQNSYMKHYEHPQRDFILPFYRYDWWRWRVESGARGWYQEGLCRQTSLDWSGHCYFTAQLQLPEYRKLAFGCCFDLQADGSSVGVAWKYESSVWLGRHLEDFVVEGHCGRDHVLAWNEDGRAPKDWTRYFKQHGVFHINCHLEDVTLKPAHRWSERIPALVESCLETVHGSGDQRRIHACAFPLLWRHQSQRWRSVCLACRGLQLFCPGCHPVAAGEATFLATLEQSPVCLGSFVEIGRLACWVAKGS